MQFPECMSEKSMLAAGSGMIPGSDSTALRCDMVSKNNIVLKTTAWNAPHKLKNKIISINVR